MAPGAIARRDIGVIALRVVAEIPILGGRKPDGRWRSLLLHDRRRHIHRIGINRLRVEIPSIRDDPPPPVTGSQLRNAVGQKQPGSVVRLSLLRQGKERTVTAGQKSPPEISFSKM